MQKIKIEVQYFNGCPNSEAVLKMVKNFIDKSELQIEFEEILVETQDAAKRYKFRGSPTILINGNDIEGLEEIAVNKRQIREYVTEYTLQDGRKINILGEGRLINLASAEGHPSSVMDMSFANQALGAEYIYKNYKKLKNKVYSIPEKIDRNIAALKLKSMGVKIDKLTKEQKKYLSSWEMGT